jgi:hypothetical protein
MQIGVSLNIVVDKQSVEFALNQLGFNLIFICIFVNCSLIVLSNDEFLFFFFFFEVFFCSFVTFTCYNILYYFSLLYCLICFRV